MSWRSQSAEALTFVDTNVLVYAYDVDAGYKHDTARLVLGSLWDARSGAASLQVLQEFYVTATRKVSRPITKRVARDVIAVYGAWKVHRPDVADIIAASELEERHHLSFWDALVVVAAQRTGARTILTEDLQNGRRFGPVTIVNPFITHGHPDR